MSFFLGLYVCLILAVNAWPPATKSACENNSLLLQSIDNDLSKFTTQVPSSLRDLTEEVNVIENTSLALKQGSELLKKKVETVSKLLTTLFPQPKSENGEESNVAIDCADIYESGKRYEGVYIIHPVGVLALPIWCRRRGSYIQRRINGLETFDRLWSDYKRGFGTPDSDYWLGLNNIHALSTQRNYSLRVEFHYDVVNADDTMWFINYASFQVGSEETKYTLNVGKPKGNVVSQHDLNRFSNGRQFTTKDNVNTPNGEAYTLSNSARSGWWLSTTWAGSYNSRASACNQYNQVCCYFNGKYLRDVTMQLLPQ